MMSSNGAGMQYYSDLDMMMAIDDEDEFPDASALLSDEDIAAILSSTSTMFMDNNGSNYSNNIHNNRLEEDQEHGGGGGGGGGKKQQRVKQPVTTRKRCRDSRNTPTNSTFLIAKACDFRGIVQQLTGCQSADSSYKGPINLNFGAPEDDEVDAHGLTTTTTTTSTTNDQHHLHTPCMLGFNSSSPSSSSDHQNSSITLPNHQEQEEEGGGGLQSIPLYEEQESSSSSSSINGRNTFNVPYYNSSSTTMMTRDHDHDYFDNIFDIGVDDIILMHELFGSFDYGSDQYSSAADDVQVTTTGATACGGDYDDHNHYYSPDYIFPATDNHDGNILFCGAVLID